MKRFASFQFDPMRRQVTRDGLEVHLTPKAFDLLQMLIECAPRVVPKHELHERLWPRTIVGDATLVGLVKELRRALDDHDPAAPLIRTAHRVGYAFCPSIDGTPPPIDRCRWLVVGERRFELRDGTNTVGRDPASAVWLNFDSVSRRHAEIVVSDAATLLRDLGSKNGTTLGAEPIAEARALCDGDVLGFGRARAVYRASAAGLPTVTQGDWSLGQPLGR